ncbi:PXMP2/4 family protein 4-like isoform X6 [Coccinella septempunctata]|uniref:PXMP2/4 family protein 4-like isoform X6 n=1 Tax=Coccinella septempunctata TaxID=41139 RepID=UPI001D08D5FC|nr:PXMP2/4 family protein 4-like isoform X6 [Coccinella septempunctata]
MKLFRKFLNSYPIVRGIGSYAIICPSGCLIQQSYEGKNFKSYDWLRVFRFSLYGVIVVAPMMHGWVKLTTFIWPSSTFSNSLKKAVLEQFTYAPVTMFCFYTVMPVLEGNSLQRAIQEQLKPKFFSTYKIALCYWPFVQTFNFYMISPKNRVPFVSICSLFWWIFLSHMNTSKKVKGSILHGKQ